MEIVVSGSTGTQFSEAGLKDGTALGNQYNDMVDQVDMARLGKTQELKRNFKLLSILSFMCVEMSTWVSVMNGSYQGVFAAGTGGYIAIYIGCSIVYLPTVLSVAEMASIAPTAGGQYHWASEFGHPRVQRLVSYIAGWLLTIAWLCGTSLRMLLCGSMVYSSILIAHPPSANANWNWTEYRYKGYISVVVMNLLALALNSVCAKQLALLEVAVAAFFVLGFASNLIFLWIMAPLNPATGVFGSFTNHAGWSSLGLSILTAQPAALWLNAGCDGAAHMAEDTQDASLNIPRGVLGSYLISATTGLVTLITFSFCYNVEDLYTWTTHPFMDIYARTTGSESGTLALTAIIIILTFFSGTNYMASASRQTYAFARDGGLPFSGAISKVSEKFHVPILAVVLVCAFAIVSVAIDKIDHYKVLMTVQMVALFATYEVAIGMMILRRLYGPPLPARRWSLGKAGLAINIFSFVYGLFAISFMVLPPAPHTSVSRLNWQVPHGRCRLLDR